MNVLRFTRSCTLAALAAIGTTLGLNETASAQQAAAAMQDGMEVLTRGPVHEAFAETITFDPEPGIVVSKAPPEPIEEIAPDQRPEGANLAWIPGYWAWDDERNDFLWVSGIWRALPPGRQWIPGYWGQAAEGAQWTSGYWADAAANEIDYLPEPPATVESGPNVAASSEDDIWVPGSWIWQQNRYAWRPGTWTPGHQDWDWVPDHYVWTPRGYVFVDGYYDYSVARRGVVFAPVYFSGGLRNQRGFSYSPSAVINTSVFGSHLFVRPGYGHYYYGDYYGSNYANSGFSPWFSYQSSYRGYDPIYANQRWKNRRNRGWEGRMQSNYRNLRDNENDRPPRTLAAQRAQGDRRESSYRGGTAVAEPYNERTRRNEGDMRFQAVDPAEREQFTRRGQEYRKYLQQRQQLEANTAPATGVDQTTAAGATRRKFSRSPYVAPPGEQLGQGYTPPQRHQVLKPDLQVQPQPRKRGVQSGTHQGFGQGTGGTTGQMQGSPQGQPQGQGANQGNRQGNRQGAHAGPSQGQGQGKGQGAGQGNHQGGSGGQGQGQGQGGPQNPAKEK